MGGVILSALLYRFWCWWYGYCRKHGQRYDLERTGDITVRAFCHLCDIETGLKYEARRDRRLQIKRDAP